MLVKPMTELPSLSTKLVGALISPASVGTLVNCLDAPLTKVMSLFFAHWIYLVNVTIFLPVLSTVSVLVPSATG